MTWNRIAAILIDSVILAVMALPFMSFGTETRVQNGQQMETFNFTLSGIESLAWAAIVLVYFVGLEWLFGATVGKFLLGLRVTRRDGHAASLVSVLIRNLTRIVDAFPYLIPYLVGFLAMGRNQGRQRLGDMLAGTIVVPKGDALYEQRP
jgi:uncharacterized RDD family membrane protein YckC